jgi:pectate lyase
MKWGLLILAAAAGVSSLAAAADGFGQFTTGGAGGATVTATTAAEFRTYVETVGTPLIIQVQGTLELSGADNGRVRIQSNKTLRGIGSNPTIIGSLGFKNDCSNVIIERLTITCPQGYTSEEDAISVKERISNVFITKCTLYDSWDGCLDIARKSDWVTVSWCKFYFTSRTTNNNRVTLVGNTDSSGDEGTLHVTFHHNWFGQMCMQRIPSVRYGRAHIYNNYYNCPGNLYCIWSRLHAECLIENNYFKDVNNPYYNIDYADAIKGKIGASGNVLDNCTGTVHPGTDTVFTPTYAYALDAASRVPAIVQWGAGADGKDGLPPHWMFGTYGDFDAGGLVDMRDFSQFAQYWLATAGIEDADYNNDGIVDDTELALFAEHWMQLPPDVTPPGAPAGLWALGQNGQAAVTWAENAEPDLAGYVVYRSTAWGTGYVRLTETPLPTAAYADTDVVNNTMYYYRVCAVDARGNESEASLDGCARPAAGQDSLTLQEDALGFCSVQGIVDYGKHAGFTGAGFLDVTNSLGTGIRWTANVAAAGSYTFRWRYANASGDRPGRLLIDGVEVMASISFPGTGAWTSWSEVSVVAAISAGVHDIRLEGIASDSLPNIDYLQLIGDAPEAAACR